MPTPESHLSRQLPYQLSLNLLPRHQHKSEKACYIYIATLPLHHLLRLRTFGGVMDCTIAVGVERRKPPEHYQTGGNSQHPATGSSRIQFHRIRPTPLVKFRASTPFPRSGGTVCEQLLVRVVVSQAELRSPGAVTAWRITRMMLAWSVGQANSFIEPRLRPERRLARGLLQERQETSFCGLAALGPFGVARMAAFHRPSTGPAPDFQLTERLAWKSGW